MRDIIFVANKLTRMCCILFFISVGIDLFKINTTFIGLCTVIVIGAIADMLCDFVQEYTE